MALGVVSFTIAGAIAYLFYDSLAGLIFWPFVGVIAHRFYRRERITEQQQQLSEGFKDLLKCLSGSFMAGYSPENALREAEKELVQMHGGNAHIVKEIEWMNQSVSINQPLEFLLEDFAERSHIEDVKSFAEVFRFAKRNGGNLVGILDSTCRHLCIKQEAQRELRVMLAQKKLEQNIMNVVPLGILAYFRIASAEYLENLYGNLFGVGFMTGCLIVYVIALHLSRQITRIEV